MQSTIPAVSPIMVATAAGKETTVSALESGRRILSTRCIACHGLEPIQKFSPEQWHSIVAQMAERAKLSPEEREQVTSYLIAARQSLP